METEGKRDTTRGGVRIQEERGIDFLPEEKGKRKMDLVRASHTSTTACTEGKLRAEDRQAWKELWVCARVGVSRKIPRHDGDHESGAHTHMPWPADWRDRRVRVHTESATSSSRTHGQRESACASSRRRVRKMGLLRTEQRWRNTVTHVLECRAIVFLARDRQRSCCQLLTGARGLACAHWL